MRGSGQAFAPVTSLSMAEHPDAAYGVSPEITHNGRPFKEVLPPPPHARARTRARTHTGRPFKEVLSPPPHARARTRARTHSHVIC